MATAISLQAPASVEQGQDVVIAVTLKGTMTATQAIQWTWEGPDYVLSVVREDPVNATQANISWSSAGMEPGQYKVTAQLVEVTAKSFVGDPANNIVDEASVTIIVTPSQQILRDPVAVSLRRTDIPITADEALWSGIRAATDAI